MHQGSEALNLRKRYRLAIRGSICLVILFLSLADYLNSLQLIGTVAALLWFVIAVETWGNAQKCHIWFGNDDCRPEYICKNTGIRCVQGEEPVQEGEENEKEEDGDIVFSV